MANTLCIFTPTYNRAYVLDTLYKSLCAQTCRDFYWLIVDDGSTDETESLIEAFVGEKRFEIKYIKQANGGKQRAWNVGVMACTAELFMCVDSDDYLVDRAVEAIVAQWKAVSSNETLVGVVTPQASRNGAFPSGQITKLTQLYATYGYEGETCIATKTVALREHQFVVFEGEKFIPELFVFDQLDQIYDHYALNKEICKGEYLADGYSARYGRLLIENPVSYSLYKLQCSTYACKVTLKFRETFLYLVWQKIAKMSVIEAARAAPHKFIAYLCCPFAVAAAPLVKEMVKHS